MGYMVPLRYVKVANKRSDVKQFDCAICATRIVAMMSTEFYQARRTIHNEKKAGTLINACGPMAAKTLIILDNGSCVASPLNISVLMNAIEKANQKAVLRPQSRMTIYDVVDEDPNPELDEEVSEISESYEEYDEYDE